MTAAAAVLLAALAAPARAALARPALSTGPVIADIVVERTNVFDPRVPGEDWLIFRIANHLHFMTRENVVRREMLLAPGDRWDPLKIIESERNLRANGSFRRAEIVQRERPDGKVEAVMRTQDSWTTNIKIDAGTEGGQSYYGYGVEENNFLGYGKTVELSHSASPNGRSDTVGYGDPRFLGSRLNLDSRYTHATGGDNHRLALARPFYSLEADNAMALSWDQKHAQEAVVQNAEEVSQHLTFNRTIDASYGKRLTTNRFFVQRAELGWYAERLGYNANDKTLLPLLPQNRDLSGPTFGYSWVQPRYIKETYIESMERVEDFNLGNEFHGRAGYMSSQTGGDRDRWIFNASERQGLSFGPGRFLLAGAAAAGRVARGRWENGLVTGTLDLYWKSTWIKREHTIAAHAEFSNGRYLDVANQIVLGGNSGLRGYKNFSFVGGKAALVNLEDRFFYDGEVLHLVRLGGAVFGEAGEVVREGDGFSPARIKSDIGFGLRAAPTRSRTGSVVRVDVAYALNSGPGRQRWVVSAVAGQAFTFANSSSRSVTVPPPSRL